MNLQPAPLKAVSITDTFWRERPACEPGGDDPGGVSSVRDHRAH